MSCSCFSACLVFRLVCVATVSLVNGGLPKFLHRTWCQWRSAGDWGSRSERKLSWHCFSPFVTTFLDLSLVCSSSWTIRSYLPFVLNILWWPKIIATLSAPHFYNLWWNCFMCCTNSDCFDNDSIPNIGTLQSMWSRFYCLCNMFSKYPPWHHVWNWLRLKISFTIINSMRPS